GLVLLQLFLLCNRLSQQHRILRCEFDRQSLDQFFQPFRSIPKFLDRILQLDHAPDNPSERRTRQAKRKTFVGFLHMGRDRGCPLKGQQLLERLSGSVIKNVSLRFRDGIITQRQQIRCRARCRPYHDSNSSASSSILSRGLDQKTEALRYRRRSPRAVDVKGYRISAGSPELFYSRAQGVRRLLRYFSRQE